MKIEARLESDHHPIGVYLKIRIRKEFRKNMKVSIKKSVDRRSKEI